MASNIPLPALDIRPVQQPDVLGEAGKILTMKSLLNNQQLQQQLAPLQVQQAQAQTKESQLALQDQQAMTKSLQDWDGKDINELPSLILKNGGSANAVFSTKQRIVDQQAKLSDIAKNDAETNSNNLKTQMEKNDQLTGGIQSVLDAPDDQLSQRLLDTANDLALKGVLDPQHLMTAKQLAASNNPQGIRQALQVMQKSAMSLTQQIQKAKSDQEAQEAAAKLPGEQAQSAQQQANLNALNTWLARNPGKTAADYEVAQAGRKSGAEAGARLGSEEALEGYKMNLQRGMLPDELKGVAPQLVPAAASQYEKASTEYAGARSAQREMNDLIDLAKSGNKIAYAYSPTTGVLTINSANGVKRVNMAEIGSYAGAGSAVDRITGWFGKQVSGASIPDDILNDMRQVHDNLTRSAQQKYSNEVQATNATYGSKFKPQDFGAPGSGASNAAVSAGPPAGATGKVKGSDGNWYWTDGHNNLGPSGGR